MVKLIKAEWYRVLNSSKLMVWLAVMLFMLIFMPYVDIITMVSDKSEITGIYFLYQYFAMGQYYLTSFFAIFAGVLVAMNYIHKTSYHEVMQGNNVHHIILSKVIVDGLLCMATFAVATFGSFGYFCIKNGFGDINGDWEIYSDFISEYDVMQGGNPQTVLRVILFVLLTLHVVLCSILIVTSIRNGLGIALVWLRWSVIEGVLSMVASILVRDMDASPKLKILSLFITQRYSMIADKSYPIPGYFLPLTIGMLLIEVALWYGVSCYGYKKQIYS